jgi:hypothetical protein
VAIEDEACTRAKLFGLRQTASSHDFGASGLAYILVPLHLTAPPRWSCSYTAPPLPVAMDITKFVSEFRESAFLLGDYSTYRGQVSRRLRIVQKKLGRATPKNAKYAAKAEVTAEDVGQNIEYVTGGD